MNNITNRCRCGKVVCLDEADAMRIVRRVQKRKGQSNPIRIYQCQYGSTHWTQQLQTKAA